MIWQIVYWAVAVCVLIAVLSFAWSIADMGGSHLVAALVAVGGSGAWAFMAFGLYDEAFGNHPTFELRKDRWACTQRHTEVVTTYAPNGNGGMMPIVSSNVVCDQYTRIDG